MIAQILLGTITSSITLFTHIGSFIIRLISLIGRLWEYPILAFFFLTTYSLKLFKIILRIIKQVVKQSVSLAEKSFVVFKSFLFFSYRQILKLGKSFFAVVRANVRLLTFAGLGLLSAAVIVMAMTYIPLSDISYLLVRSEPAPIQIYDRNGDILYTDQDRVLENNNSSYKRAPHAVDYVFEELDEKSKKRLLSRGGSVKTTLDISLQNAIQQELLASALKNNSYKTFEVAVIVVDKDTGEIVSMIGSLNYFAGAKGRANGATAPVRIGGLQTSLNEIAQVYVSLINKKEQTDGYLVQSITDSSGRILYEPALLSKEVESKDAILKALAQENSMISAAVIDGKDGKRKIVVTKSNSNNQKELMGRIVENISSSKQAHSNNLSGTKPDVVRNYVEARGGEQ